MDTIARRKRRMDISALIVMGISGITLVICLWLKIDPFIATIPMFIGGVIGVIHAILTSEDTPKKIQRWLGEDGWIQRTIADPEFNSAPNPPYATQYIDVHDIEQKTTYWFNQQLDLWFMSFQYYRKSEKYLTPGYYFAIHTPKTVNGWLSLTPTTGREIEKDISMESVEFNDRVRVWASDKKLPYTLLPPDIMDWYLHLEEMPWIYYGGSWICLGFQAEYFDFAYVKKIPSIADQLRQLMVQNKLLF